VIQAAKTPVEA